MPGFLKHLALITVALPLSFVGYHLASGGAGVDGDAEAATRALLDSVGAVSGQQPDLGRLALLERTLYIVDQEYVEKGRLKPEEMFDSALDAVERQVHEVMFIRQPKGKRLQISVGSFTTTLLLEPIRDLDDLGQQLRRVGEVMDEHLSDEVERADVEYALINGALSTLDPHSLLFPPPAAREFEVDNSGEFGGLGIEITTRDGRLTVKQPLEDTPAARAGLKAADHIVRIEDESTVNMDLSDAVSRLRGEVGTPVTILVKRKELTAPKKFTIIRAAIRINPVEGELLDGNIGYVRIKTFSRHTSESLDELLTEFKSKGELKGLILDLRANPGGYLNQAVEVSDHFLDEGVIVSTVEGGTRRRREQRASRSGTESPYPVAVLVNGNSASASEIVAGALRNQDRAVVIGERTFGKGSVQHVYENRGVGDGTSLKLTVAQYLTPGDHNIQSVGIPPDIQLRPSVVEPPKGEDPDPTVLMLWRDWIDREADLDRHLENDPVDEVAAPYEIRYLRDVLDEDAPTPKPGQDWEAQFARDVLVAAEGRSRRADVLVAAKSVVERHSADEQARLEKAFASIGLDWSAGANPAAPQLEARLDLGEDGAITAGVREQIAIEVTNNGDAPVYRLLAVTDCKNPWLSHREFYFGRLDPGETRRFEQPVELHEGYPAEELPLSITLRDPDNARLAESKTTLRTLATKLPSFTYRYRLLDDGSGKSKGDGDGLPEVGEIVELEVTVTNRGEGPSGHAFARVKNRSRRALDLSKGTLNIGESRDQDGKPCDPDDAEEGCETVLEPGASYTGRFSFELRELPEDGFWTVGLQIGDNQRYDYSTIHRGGFVDYFELKETLELHPDKPLVSEERTPPLIALSRAPSGVTAASDVVFSGEVSDADGIRDVMIFHGEEKVFFRGGDANTERLPFSVDPSLEPGLNTVFVLARDHSGLSATYSAVTWHPEGE